MLEALLEPLSYNESGESETSAERLVEEDRQTIEKCIPSPTFKSNDQSFKVFESALTHFVRSSILHLNEIHRLHHSRKSNEIEPDVQVPAAQVAREQFVEVHQQSIHHHQPRQPQFPTILLNLPLPSLKL